MYRRPKFLEILLEIRREMALESDYDVVLFAENVRSGNGSGKKRQYSLEPSDSESEFVAGVDPAIGRAPRR